MHTTNYFDTFIAIAEDCPVTAAEVPPVRDPKSTAQIQHELLAGHPYEYTWPTTTIRVKMGHLAKRHLTVGLRLNCCDVGLC